METVERIKEQIEAGDISVGIELGSTRIKTVAVNAQCETIATGSFEWENTFKDGFWTTDLMMSGTDFKSVINR